MAENEILKWYNKNPKTKSVTIVRPTVIFGERNRGNVYNLLSQISTGRFLMVGSGKNLKSMAYVGNICEFINQIIKTKQIGYNVYNYSDKPDMNMNDLVSIIESKLDIKTPKIKIPYYLGIFLAKLIDIFSVILNKSLKYHL